MKSALYIFLFVFCQPVLSQIIYEPVFINPCTNEEDEEIPYWQISDSTRRYKSDDFEPKNITLPRAGTYMLHLEFGLQTIKVVVPNTPLFRDTVLLKRLELVHYISNPPHSEFLDCGNLANGEIIDYYNDGSIRQKGKFENGQPIDSLFTYHSNGNLSELFVPHRKGWEKTNYFENGRVQSYYNVAKRVEKEYYSSGQLKLITTWNSRYRSKTKKFDKKGNLILKETRTSQKKYWSEGGLQSKITRKEILIFDRIFSKDKSRFYEYNWTTYDSNETILRKITFNGFSFQGNRFPNDYKDIQDFSFDELIFYSAGKPYRKIHFETKKEGDEYVEYLFLSRIINDEWSVSTQTTIDRIYEFISNLSD